MGFLDYFKVKTNQKDNASSLLFFHEDDFCQIQLLPKENLNFIKLQCTQIEDSSQKNFDGVSYKEVFIRDENPIELCTKQIQKNEFENSLLAHKFQRASKVLTGYGQSYRILAPDTIGFGCDYAAIYFNFHNDIVKNIWLTQAWNLEREKLILFLNKVGLKWDLLLVDWEAAVFVDLSNKQAILNYLS